MKVVIPTVPTLKSTNVAAYAESEWSDVVTYGLNNLVKVTTSAPNKVYKSLRDNNINKQPADNLEPVEKVGNSATSLTIGISSQVLTTDIDLGLLPGMAVRIAKTTTPSSVYMTGEVTAYDSGTGSLTVDVTAVKGAGAHSAWTITNVDEIGFWEEVSSTNQYAMLDEYVNTQTEYLEEIFVKLNVERIDYLTLFGIEGNLIELFLWDATETTLLWSKTIDLLFGNATVASISDWYEYFFGELDKAEDATSDIGVILYSGVLGIRITAGSGETAKCGNVVVGRAFEIGDTQYGASAGMFDFSYSETDNQGRTTVVPGYWAKRNDMRLYIENELVDYVYKTLVKLRGVPTAWVGNNDTTSYESLVVYGVFRDFEITLKGASHSICDLTITGLT